MAAVAQEKGLGFGEAIGKELGIVDGKKIELPAILTDKPFKGGGKCTPSAWRQCPDQAMQSPAVAHFVEINATRYMPSSVTA